MSDAGVVWLAVIAISVAVMALIQIVVLIAIARLALQAVRGVKELRSEIRPLIELCPGRQAVVEARDRTRALGRGCPSGSCAAGA